MRKAGRVPSWIWWPNAVLILVMTGVVALQVRNNSQVGQVNSLMVDYHREILMFRLFKRSQKRAMWIDADCVTREVITTKTATETQSQFCARHDHDVAHDMQVYGVKETVLADLKFLTQYLKAHPQDRIQSERWPK